MTYKIQKRARNVNTSAKMGAKQALIVRGDISKILVTAVFFGPFSKDRPDYNHNFETPKRLAIGARDGL